MLDLDLIIDGKYHTKDHRIYFADPMHLSGPVRDVKAISIPGRNGDLLVDNGRFKNRKAEFKLFALHPLDVSWAMTGLLQALSAPGYHRIQVSDDPDHFLMGRLVKGGDRAIRAGVLNGFKLSLDCKPQRFRVDGEQAVDVTTDYQLTNRYMTSEPLVKLTFADGPAVPLYLNFAGGSRPDDYSAHISIGAVSGNLVIDSDSKTIYRIEPHGGHEMVREVSIDSYPEIKHGHNVFSAQTDAVITKVEITPRWWDL